MPHQRASVVWVCQYPETAWWRLAALAPRSETLFVHSTAGSVVNSQTWPALSRSQQPSV
jgi:hypothetical protein